MITLTTDYLLTMLTKEEYDELSATLIEEGQECPTQLAIDGALGEINLYVSPHTLGDAILTRLWIALAVPLLYPRRAVVPDKHKQERDWARSVLKDIRDGKFPNLGVSSAGPGAWGSAERFDP